ncbi:MAG: SDR family NAD(P)-dependent oxidoreductase [Kofleriaceae bacterium]|nr:SDR family NAD(P)-dependent oxidoreductase [Kofleriaceae bacterium]
MSKNNKVWFITGASKGLGLVLAKQALARGYRVAATSRSVDDLVKAVGGKTGALLPLAMEVTDEASVRAAVGATLAHFDALDVVVNNAGYGQLGTPEEASDAEARRNYDVNVFGVLNVLRASLPHLREQRSGHVFNIASIGGLFGGFTGWSIYCSTKFAVAGITESLRADVAPFGVDVTLVYPGYFRTEFLTSGSLRLPERPNPAYEEARASEMTHTAQINGAQPGDPEKAARAMLDIYDRPTPPLHLFLGSDAVKMAEQKLRELAADLDANRAVSVGTDF